MPMTRKQKTPAPLSPYRFMGLPFHRDGVVACDDNVKRVRLLNKLMPASPVVAANLNRRRTKMLQNLVFPDLEERKWYHDQGALDLAIWIAFIHGGYFWTRIQGDKRQHGASLA